MDKYIINTLKHKNQETLLCNYELSRLNGNDVFCPMCEDTHDNNTNCQRND